MARFKCIDASVKKTFVIELLDEVRIAEARAIIASETRRGVMGTVVAKTVDYNKPWSWHLEPSSISFFEMAIEVCDSNVDYLEEHLEEIGGPFLPHNHWCPWSSKLVEEIG